MPLCNHMDGVKRCNDNPLPGEAALMVIADVTAGEAWPRLRGVHDDAHGELVKVQDNPQAGVRALYELRHNTSATQTTGVIDGSHVAWSGGAITFIVRHAGGDVAVVLDQPEGC